MCQALTRVFALAVILSITAATSAQTGLGVSFTSHEVVASNAAAGSQVLFFGDQVEPRTYTSAYFHGADIVTASGTGTATFDIRRPIPRSSVWIAVDLATGDTAVGLQPGSTASEYVFNADTLKHEFTGNIAKLDLPFLLADILLVRPGEGAWRVSAADGGRHDGDGLQNGQMTLSLEALDEIEKDKKPPHALKKGDVLVIVSPRSLRYAVIKVKE